MAEVGELLVGAYLKVVEGCDFVGYNVRPAGGGLEGLEELDVVGFHFDSKTAFLCEVTTHIRGLLYKNNRESVARVKKKHQRQRKYATDHLRQFPNRRFMFWSPVVPKGYLTEELAKIKGLELVINREYAEAVDRLRQCAAERANDEGNAVFRVLQILGHLRR